MYQPCRCGHNNYQEIKLGRKNNFQLLRCIDCGLIRTWPLPKKQSEQGGRYQDEQDSRYRLENLKLWRNFSLTILGIIKKYQKQGKFLDVGCNLGVLVAEASKAGYEGYGIDIDEVAINSGRKILKLGDQLNCGGLEKMNFSNEFSVITYLHVMEHIENLNEELAAARTALKDKGMILVSSPNFNSVWRRVLGPAWRGLTPDQHYWRFTGESLEKILKQNGFKIIKTIRSANLLYDLKFSPEGVVKIILIAISKVFKQGDNLIVLAEKNS
jgi:2-polyprenyl-3-methyl-5-hydroxy-6-metoxy-1,4-benzoquinol methylase